MEMIGVRHGGVKHSLHILLKSLIDYAGLFPPSGLEMAQAVANYASYRVSVNAWALGRFIIPAARLAEFEQYFVQDRGTWHLGALIGSNVTDDLAKIAEFNSRHHHAAVIDMLEAKAGEAKEIADLRRQIPESLIVYFEIPTSGDFRPLIESIGAVHSRAKLRTGGLTQEMFPPAQQIIQFFKNCVAANVPFKATAGLHHPIRCIKPLTYEKDGPTGTMHGFLNVFLAAAFLADGLPGAELEALLHDDDASHFVFDDGAITWRGHRLSQARLLESRALAASFGSCSFEEPIEDLRSLHFL